jgi:hypothetical protein
VLTPLTQLATATLTYADQPHVVKRLQQAAWGMGVVATGAHAAGAMPQTAPQAQQPAKSAQPNKAVQVAVAGAALVGTGLATHKLGFNALPKAHTLPAHALHTIAEQLGPKVAAVAQKSRKSVADFKTLLTAIGQTPGLTATQRNQLKTWLLPTPALEDDPMHEVGTFLKLGTASVGSGLLGGMVGNAATLKQGNLPAQLKEGLFQLGVNIGVCGVGAAVGIKAAEVMGHANNRLARAGWIGVGLVVGIAAGNAVSGLLEKTVVDPLAKATGNTELAADPARKVHLTDVLMHVDDLPLMLMFAGVEAAKPIIPLCFLMSGIKTGLAHKGQTPNKPLPNVDHTGHAHTAEMGQTFGAQPPLQQRNTNPAFRPFTAIA